MKFNINVLLLLPALMLLACSSPTNKNSEMKPSQNPPGGLKPSQVTMFVAYGFDDNYLSGDAPADSGKYGMRWIMNFMQGLKNPAGSGNAATYDGAPVRATFYVTAKYLGDSAVDAPGLLKKVWNDAFSAGHEIGNHTFTHPHGAAFTTAQWTWEIQTCIKWITRPLPPANADIHLKDTVTGPGIPANQIFGFRDTYLEYEMPTIEAGYKCKMVYDCSIEEGLEPDQDGTNFYWPYTLDHGSPVHEMLRQKGEKKTKLGSYPGYWEMPAYCLIVPPDDKCAQYGIPKGLREKMHHIQDYFDPAVGKLTGFDWNTFVEFSLSKPEVLAILKYTFDLRYNGNRCPFLVGGHTQFYHPSYQNHFKGATIREAQEVTEEFIKWVLQKPDVRVVPVVKVLDWCRNPVPLHK